MERKRGRETGVGRLVFLTFEEFLTNLTVQQSDAEQHRNPTTQLSASGSKVLFHPTYRYPNHIPQLCFNNLAEKNRHFLLQLWHCICSWLHSPLSTTQPFLGSDGRLSRVWDGRDGRGGHRLGASCHWAALLLQLAWQRG